MKRKMKKLLALFLAMMVMCTLITVPTFAADEENQGTASVNARTYSTVSTASNGYIYKITVSYLNTTGSTMCLREYLSEYFRFCDSEGELLTDASATYDGKACTISDYTISEDKEGTYISFEVPSGKKVDKVTYYVRPIDGFLGGANVQAWNNKISGLYDVNDKIVYPESGNSNISDVIESVMVRNDGVEVNNLYAYPGATLGKSRIKDLISIEFMKNGKNAYADVSFTIKDKETMVEICNFTIKKGVSYWNTDNIDWKWNEEYDFNQKLTGDKKLYVEVKCAASKEEFDDNDGDLFRMEFWPGDFARGGVLVLDLSRF